MSLKQISKMIAFGAAHKVFKTVGVDPQLVKAAIRRPKSTNGGFKVRRWPWPRRRHIGKEERAAVLSLLNREMREGNAIIYGGVESLAYCSEFSNFLGGGYSLPVNSGTNAVYVALRTLDLQPGDEVIVPAISDPGGVMPVALMNCIPVPADTMPGSLNTSIDQIQSVVTDRTKAIVITHIAGHPVDLDPILHLANERGIAIVEDCAQAHGSTYKGKMIGTIGDIAAFSTMFGKQHCTGGQGGIVYTNSSMLFARARQITDRGKPFSVVGGSTNIVASLNFNQDEMSLAMGRVQLKKLPVAIAGRRRFAKAVEHGVRDVPGVELIGDPPDSESSYWFLMVYLDPVTIRCNNAEFANALAEEGIGGVSGGYPFYPTDQPWCQEAVVFGTSGQPWTLVAEQGRKSFLLPNAYSANQQLVRVEVHESLGETEARDLVDAIKKVASRFSS